MGLYWTRERIVEAFQRWFDETGTVPTQNDWPTARASHPHHRTVAKRFGSWNAGIYAAGFTPRTPFGGLPPTADRKSRILQAICLDSTVDIDAHALGVLRLIETGRMLDGAVACVVDESAGLAETMQGGAGRPQARPVEKGRDFRPAPDPKAVA